jgi:2-dehydro-3-deoxygluconokinase
MPALVEMTDVLLGDSTAFDLYFGIKAEDEETLLQKMAKRFPKLTHIAMTSRQGFSASHNTYRGILFDGQKIAHSRTHEMPDMLDRIGGGDAFMAGLIFGLHKMHDDSQQIIEFAAAAAALKHYIRGDFNLSTEAEVLALMAGNAGGRVSR